VNLPISQLTPTSPTWVRVEWKDGLRQKFYFNNKEDAIKFHNKVIEQENVVKISVIQ